MPLLNFPNPEGLKRLVGWTLLSVQQHPAGPGLVMTFRHGASDLDVRLTLLALQETHVNSEGALIKPALNIQSEDQKQKID